MKKVLYIFGLLVALLGSCTHPSPHTPVAQTQYDTVFTYCQEKLHGAFYAREGVDNQVVALDLYSYGLKLTKKGIVGTGTNLVFSDVFLTPEDARLLPGDYSANDNGEPYTYLLGKDFTGTNITGAYLLLIDDGELQAISILKEGVLHVENEGDSTILSFDGKMADGKAYRARYKGVLDVVDARGK